MEGLQEEPGKEDAELIETVLRGHTEAFSTLVEKYQRPVYFTALRMVSEHEDASDLAQQTFINAYRALQTFRKESRFKTWLFQIAINLCRNHIKTRGRQPDFEDIDESDVADNRKRPLDHLTEEEQSAQLRKAIATLPDQQRATVILRVYEDYSYEQISGILGCAEETARAHYHHGLKAIRKALQATEQVPHGL